MHPYPYSTVDMLTEGQRAGALVGPSIMSFSGEVVLLERPSLGVSLHSTNGWGEHCALHPFKSTENSLFVRVKLTQKF